MTIITHLKIAFIITFLSCLIYWNLLNFSCKCEVISSTKVVLEHFFADIGQDSVIKKPFVKTQQINCESPSGLCIGVEMLNSETQSIRIFMFFQYLVRMYLTFSSVILFSFYVSRTKRLNTDQFLDSTTFSNYFYKPSI